MTSRILPYPPAIDTKEAAQRHQERKELRREYPYVIVDRPKTPVTSPHRVLFDAIASELLVTSHENRMRLLHGGRIEFRGLGDIIRRIIEEETYLVDVPRAAVWWVLRGRDYTAEMVVKGFRALNVGWGDFEVVSRFSKKGGTPVPASFYWPTNALKPSRLSTVEFRRAKHSKSAHLGGPHVHAIAYSKDGALDLQLEELGKKLEALPRSLSDSLYEAFSFEWGVEAELTSVMGDACQEAGQLLLAQIAWPLSMHVKEWPCYFIGCHSRGVPRVFGPLIEFKPGELKNLRCHRHRFVRDRLNLTQGQLDQASS